MHGGSECYLDGTPELPEARRQACNSSFPGRFRRSTALLAPYFGLPICWCFVRQPRETHTDSTSITITAIIMTIVTTTVTNHHRHHYHHSSSKARFATVSVSCGYITNYNKPGGLRQDYSECWRPEGQSQGVSRVVFPPKMSRRILACLFQFLQPQAFCALGLWLRHSHLYLHVHMTSSVFLSSLLSPIRTLVMALSPHLSNLG